MAGSEMHKTAEQDLDEKVGELLQRVTKLGFECLERLKKSGVGIVEDHANSPGSYVTPKNFIAALGMEIEREFAPFKGSVHRRTAKKRINQYYLHM